MAKQPELVMAAEIEDLFGISRIQLGRLARKDREWMQRANLWPEPVATLKAGRIWRLSDVQAAVTRLRSSGRL